jgi:hypothetical protein
MSLNIIDVISDKNLIGGYLKEKDGSFANWKVFLKAVYALPMDEKEIDVYKKFTARQKPPEKPAESVYCISGRKSGKTLLASTLAIHISLFEDFWHSHIRPGQKIYLPIIAVDKTQARECFDYCDGILHSNSIFKKQVVKSLAWEIELKNSCVIMIRTANFRSARGPLYCSAIIDELAFLRDESSRNPADELIKGILPGLLPGGKLIGISSAYGRFGTLYSEYKSHWAQNDDETLIWLSDTISMNPFYSQKKIEKALKADRTHALAEYYSQFRDDITNFIPANIVESAVIPSRYELPRLPGVTYTAHIDPSGGSGQDSMTLAISHFDDRTGKVILDVLKERRPPFKPKSVVSEFSDIMKSFDLGDAKSDHYAAEWVRESFSERGIIIENFKLSSSESYANFLPIISNGECELLDNDRLKAQLIGLERKTRPGGKDLITHYPGCHDDLAVSTAASLIQAKEGATTVTETIVLDDEPGMSEWERMMILRNNPQNIEAKDDTEIMKLTTEATAKRYIELCREGYQSIDDIAKVMRIEPALLRKWVSLKRDFIDEISRSTREGEGEGILEV